ncbi:sugar ABC transporter permease [Anaerolineales bacterium]
MTTTQSKKGSGFRTAVVKENISAWLFIAPAVLIIFVFGIFPIGYAIYMSLYKYRGPLQRGFEGIENYVKIFGDWGGLALFLSGFIILYVFYLLWDRYSLKMKHHHQEPNRIRWVILAIVLFVSTSILSIGWERMFSTGNNNFLKGLIYTVYYAVGSVPFQLGLGLILAYVLFQNIRGKSFYRMIFFLPYVTPAVAAAVVFKIVFSPRATSLANQVVGMIGMPAQKWIQEPKPFINVFFGLNLEGFWAGPSMALVSIIAMGIWTYVGYNAVIFLAGLGSIPADLYDAAEVDGANTWHRFRYITFPLISPITFYLSILAFIGTFKAFNHIYVMSDANALGTTDTASIVIFNTFYKSNKLGEATAQAIVLFLIILAITFIQRNIIEKKVFYG